MSSRHHWFSHIENLTTGSLVLDDPFDVPRREGSVCRYQLHRAPLRVLEPDPDLEGIAAWRQLLPFPPDMTPPTGKVLDLKPEPHPLAENTASLQRVTFAADLADRFAISFNPKASQGEPWRNPYRLEAYKVLGLELAFRFSGNTPALIVPDAAGELIFGLVLASENIRAVQPDRMPYRLILVQSRPGHHLCQAFEGAQPDWSAIEEARQPPETIPTKISEAIQQHLGTAVVLEADQAADPFTPALEKLVRTGFVDDEDDVVLIGP
ncbi:MAG: hypothetical protein QNK37_10580 [Acidobacteriota bacterium]|nr:hypothetical protein [Acidobacteriota bacterium]